MGSHATPLAGTWPAPAAPPVDPRERRHHRALSLGLALLLAALVLAGAWALHQVARHHETQAGEELRAIAHLKAGQVERWLAERRQDAQLLSSSPDLAQGLHQWLETRDPAALERTRARLDAIRLIEGFEALMLLDAAGEVLLGVGQHHPVAAPVRSTLAGALASGEIALTDLYRDQVDGVEHVHLDLVAPLADSAGTLAYGLVLRLDLDSVLFPLIAVWPRPTRTAEALLVRREGDAVIYLNHLRFRPGAPLSLAIPLTAERVLAGRVVSGRAPLDQPIEGLDYRGEAVLGVAVPIAGTAWFLIAEMDRSQIAAGPRADLRWMALALALALLLILVGGLLLVQRAALQVARVRTAEQGERLRALQLLDAIVTASSDLIFAKDRAGRYLLLNQAAALACGQPPGAVIGRDDRALFPPAQAAMLMENDRRVMGQDRPSTVQETLQTPGGSITFLATKGPLHDAAGRVTGMFGIARDISERARAEEANRRQLEELTRWQQLTLGREGRILDLKNEVNALLAAAGQGPRYPSAAAAGGDAPPPGAADV